jgi:hypothetical protein
MRNPLDLATGRVRRIQDGVRQTRATVTRPKPPVMIDIGPTVPAWVLRLVCVAFGVLALIMLDPGIVATVIAGISLLVLLFLPNPGTGALFCGLLALFWMVTPSPPFSVDQFAILALGPAVWTMAGVLTDLPLRTKIEWRSLRIPTVRYLIIQLIGQGLLTGATVLQTATRQAEPMLTGLTAFGFAALLAAAAWWILPRFSRDQPSKESR